MRCLVTLSLVLGSACDCYQTQETDSGPALGDAAPDAGPDAAHISDSGSDSSHPDAGEAGPDPGVRCTPDQIGCPEGEPYCCYEDREKFTQSRCYALPTMPAEPDDSTDCYEIPPTSALAQECGVDQPCPEEDPWCCHYGGHAYCSAAPLLGWECTDPLGRPVDGTRWLPESWVSRCAEGAPCPEERPFCCSNLFCAPNDFYGWDCHVAD